LDFAFVYSSGLDLDVLPPGVDKGSAAERLAGELGYTADKIFTVGNSANDAALMEGGFRGIAVNNAHEELKALDRPQRVYVARKSRADGVLEGIAHWIGVDA
jgi:hydroxymethylpyrimidine pyrophosphatase-like HAD family hydrolase